MIEKEELLSLIPHKDRMFLLSRVTGYNIEKKSIEAQYDVTENCLFYDSQAGGVPTWAGIEFIAQAISALIGIKDRELGLPPKKGYILGISRMQFKLPYIKTGSIITIKTRCHESVDPIYIFEGEIFFNGEEILSGKLTVIDIYDQSQP